MVLTAIKTALTTVTSKVYPLKAPQSVHYPYILYGVVSLDADDSKDGVEVDNYLVQISILAEKLSEVDAWYESVRTALDRASTSTYKIIFQSCDGDDFDEDEQIYHRASVYKVREIK